MRRTSKTPLRRRLARPGLALAATFLALLASELLVRLLRAAPEIKAIDLASEDCVYRRSTNPILGFELKANYRNAAPDFIESYERTNAHGQRDKERALEKKPGVRRVLLLGDSVVEGHGLAEEDTISRQWEALVENGSTEVLNFGVSAYCTLAEIELLETKGLAFDPDVVVVLFVENDFDNFNREAFSLGSAIERPGPVKWLFQKSQLFRLASIRLDLFQFGAEADPVRWNREAIGDNNVVEGFRRLRELADREGFRPLVAIWPRFLDDGIVNRPVVSENDPAPLAERLASMHGLPSVRMASAFQLEGATAANPRVTFSSGDGLHPSPRGAALAAASLKQHVASLVSGEAKPPQVVEKDRSVIALAQSLGGEKPNYARVYHYQGVAFLKKGQYQDAIEQFQRALDEDPRHAGAHGNMGVVYERLGKSVEAKRHFKMAIERNSEFVQGHFNLARLLLAEGSGQGALGPLRRVVEIDPNHTDALNLLGMELGKIRAFAEAQAYLERAVKIEPDFSEAHNNLGAVFAASGEWEKALQQFKEAVRADPDNQGAVSRLEQVERMLQERGRITP